MIRVARKIMKVEATKRDAPGALFMLYRLMHSLESSELAIWLKTVDCMRGHEIAASFCRTKAEEDIEADFNIVGDFSLPTDVMKPGVAIMYLIKSCYHFSLKGQLETKWAGDLGTILVY